MDLPSDPVAAVTHPDPYPYYAELIRKRPFHFDPALNLWIASSAEAVEAVLQSPLCRVRPPAEPIPHGLRGGAAEQIFGRLARMTDGPDQAAIKQAILSVLSPLQQDYIAGQAWYCARAMLKDGALSLDDFLFALPVHTVAALLGIPERLRIKVAAWTGVFVRGVAPNATPQAVRQANDAVTELRRMFEALLASRDPSLCDGLLWRLQDAAIDRPDAVTANAIGLLMQSYDATAGLIGNALLALHANADLCRAIINDRALLPDFILEVLRHDAPIQNTRRFVAEDGMILDQSVKAGDAILVVLAAANRDPATNAEPDRFLLGRNPRRLFIFGRGQHACPGERIAMASAAAATEALLDGGLDLRKLPTPAAYRPSVNARIPMFKDETLFREVTS
ncbi:cytochrome P450 [uncultured Ferrovibrio sp.]|jgi:cytochrome P450|uniref:cytochrome P450 n=1 Tax=uncultured Ferrovibrio sp. TaxID=1576913 RepID=UPI0026256519|nr:cytochrome P450 [uncultured Ferrovibrio sp.]